MSMIVFEPWLCSVTPRPWKAIAFSAFAYSSAAAFTRFAVHAVDFFQFVEVERAEAIFKFGPVLAALLDEFAVHQSGSQM